MVPTRDASFTNAPSRRNASSFSGPTNNRRRQRQAATAKPVVPTTPQIGAQQMQVETPSQKLHGAAATITPLVGVHRTKAILRPKLLPGAVAIRKKTEQEELEEVILLAGADHHSRARRMLQQTPGIAATTTAAQVAPGPAVTCVPIQAALSPSHKQKLLEMPTTLNATAAAPLAA